jgi:hypothetical protein
MWLSISLGSLLENIERSLDKAFNLPTDQYIELDVTALLRTDFTGRIDALTKGIQGGLFTVNEARIKEGLSPAESGDIPFLQAQMVPINHLKPEQTQPAVIPEVIPPVIPEEEDLSEEEIKSIAKRVLKNIMNKGNVS